MQFTNERFKKALQRRKAKRKLTTQEQQEKLEALESRVPEQMVFQFDDTDRLMEVDNDKS